MRFCVLASGSSGNASLLRAGDFGLLLDIGIGPRSLARRLAEVGATWSDVSAAILTHIHGDHWNENTLFTLLERRIPLHCHPHHAHALKGQSAGFAALLDSDLLCLYEVGTPIRFGDDIVCHPIALRHDGGTTCGFRMDGKFEEPGQTWSLGYAADLGSWDSALADAFADVDVLAVEFNHDERLERFSGRAAVLIKRVLSDHGHLSNTQAAGLVGAVLACSQQGRLRHVVQLHLSRQCNRMELARVAAQRILRPHAHIALHTADQDSPGAWIAVRPFTAAPQMTVATALVYEQAWLPGWELL